MPDISKWDTRNIFNLSFLFFECSKLEELPDISKWNANNAVYLVGLFFKCSSLISLPDISKWNIFNYNINDLISFLESTDYFKNPKIIQKSFEHNSSIYNNRYDDLFIEDLNFIMEN